MAIRYPFKSSKVRAIYEAYPRRQAPANAEKAIEKALKIVPFVDLLAAVQAYAESVEGAGERYIRLPASWMNGACWANESSKPKSTESGYHRELKKMAAENSAEIAKWNAKHKRGD